MNNSATTVYLEVSLNKLTSTKCLENPLHK